MTTTDTIPVTYATRYGSTREVAEKVAAALREAGERHPRLGEGARLGGGYGKQPRIATFRSRLRVRAR